MLSVESYPNLKADKNFLKLQGSWNEVEEQISASRRYCNSAITDYNDAIESFPANLLASRFNFAPKTVFVLEDSERKNVNAQALFKQ